MKKQTKWYSNAWVKAFTLIAFMFLGQACEDQELVDKQPAIATQGLNLEAVSLPVPLLKRGVKGKVTVPNFPFYAQNTILTFKKTDEDYIRIASTDVDGSYRVDLKDGSYYVTLCQSPYQSVSTYPAVVTVSSSGYIIRDFAYTAPSVQGLTGKIKYDSNGLGGVVTFTDVSTGVAFSEGHSPSSGYVIELPIGTYTMRITDKYLTGTNIAPVGSVFPPPIASGVGVFKNFSWELMQLLP